MRERHETEEDGNKESEVAAILDTLMSQGGLQPSFEFLQGARMVKSVGTLEHTYKVDWIAATPKDASGQRLIRCWAELKCRNHNMARYPTLYLTVHKWNTMRQLAASTGVPMVIFALFTDCLSAYVDYGKDEVNFDVVYDNGQTADTKDSGDIEPIVLIPIDWFAIL
jgi:hypothetical protein